VSALISSCGLYRYRLGRSWDTLTGAGTVLWVMLNPSTADAEQDDPTIQRCVGFAKRWGYAGISVGNLYAYRATKPADLWDAAEILDVRGSANDQHLCEMARDASLIMCAWGSYADHHRAVRVIALLRRFLPLHCLGTTKGGQPLHPLYVPNTRTPIRLECSYL